MSAFTNSGRSDIQNRLETKGWKRPQPDSRTGLKLVSNSLFGDEPRTLQRALDVDSF